MGEQVYPPTNRPAGRPTSALNEICLNLLQFSKTFPFKAIQLVIFALTFEHTIHYESLKTPLVTVETF